VKGPEWFYVAQNRTVLLALLALKEEGVRPDSITLIQRLKDTGRLEDAGGMVYISTLPEASSSVEQLDYYLTIVREKFVARSVLALCSKTAGSLEQFEASLEPKLNELAVEVGKLQLIQVDPALGPARVKKPIDLVEAYWDAWFGGKNGEPPGKYLPIAGFKKFPFKFRPSEVTFLLGDKGNGKSTLLSEILLHLAAQGERIVVASMETPGGVSLQMMAAQLLGESRLPDDEWGHARRGRRWPG
jgi:replicative DNA helicase